MATLLKKGFASVASSQYSNRPKSWRAKNPQKSSSSTSKTKKAKAIVTEPTKKYYWKGEEVSKKEFQNRSEMRSAGWEVQPTAKITKTPAPQQVSQAKKDTGISSGTSLQKLAGVQQPSWTGGKTPSKVNYIYEGGKKIPVSPAVYKKWKEGVVTPTTTAEKFASLYTNIIPLGQISMAITPKIQQSLRKITYEKIPEEAVTSRFPTLLPRIYTAKRASGEIVEIQTGEIQQFSPKKEGKLQAIYGGALKTIREEPVKIISGGLLAVPLGMISAPILVAYPAVSIVSTTATTGYGAYQIFKVPKGFRLQAFGSTLPHMAVEIPAFALGTHIGTPKTTFKPTGDIDIKFTIQKRPKLLSFGKEAPTEILRTSIVKAERPFDVVTKSIWGTKVQKANLKLISHESQMVSGKSWAKAFWELEVKNAPKMKQTGIISYEVTAKKPVTIFKESGIQKIETPFGRITKLTKPEESMITFKGEEIRFDVTGRTMRTNIFTGKTTKTKIGKSIIEVPKYKFKPSKVEKFTGTGITDMLTETIKVWTGEKYAPAARRFAGKMYAYVGQKKILTKQLGKISGTEFPIWKSPKKVEGIKIVKLSKEQLFSFVKKSKSNIKLPKIITGKKGQSGLGRTQTELILLQKTRLNPSTQTGLAIGTESIAKTLISSQTTTPIVTPFRILSTRIGTITKPSTKITDIQRQLAFTSTRTKERMLSLPSTRSIEAIFPIQTSIQRTAQRTTQRTITRTTTRTINDIFTPFPPPPATTTPSFIGFPFLPTLRAVKRKPVKIRKRKTRYQASLLAVTFKIFGKKPKILTGLGLRPLIRGEINV